MIRVAVIGLGGMGRFHVEVLSSLQPWVHISAITDPHRPFLEQAGSLSPGATVFDDPMACLEHGGFDAALVATADETHYEIVRACLDRAIPVLCEKPLTTSPQHALDLVRAEQRNGGRLIQVGFTRRYDADYRQLKRTLAGGQAGTAMLVRHRNHNPSAAIDFDAAQLISSSAAHDIDLFRWFTAEEVAEVSCSATQSPDGGTVAVLLALRSTSGILGLSEVIRGPGCQYDIGCEVIAAAGSIHSGAPSRFTRAVGAAGAATFLPDTWIERFDAAYRAQDVDWATSVARKTYDGPTAYDGSTAYDGYAAVAVTDAAVRALQTGRTTAVDQQPPGPLHARKSR